MQIDDGIINYLKSAAFALVPVKMSLGEAEEVLFLVKSSRDVLTELKAKGGARLGWIVRETVAGPVFCALFDSAAGGAARLTIESYLDPFDEGDHEMLKEIAAQPKLRAALFDEDTEIVGLIEVRWGEIEKLILDQAIDRAEELSERALLDSLELDFDKACGIFREEATIEKLAEIAFSGDLAEEVKN